MRPRPWAGGSEALAYLRELYQELDQAGYGGFVRFDLGLVHQIDYYTGVVFRGYVEGAGAPVLSGGRYDNLVELFRPARRGHRLCRRCGCGGQLSDGGAAQAGAGDPL